MSLTRAFFIDGPDHGTTRTFESDPPREWFTSGEIGLQGVLRKDDNEMPSMLRHRYVRTYQTRKKTWIYEYDGTTT